MSLHDKKIDERVELAQLATSSSEMQLLLETGIEVGAPGHGLDDTTHVAFARKGLLK